MVYSFLNINCSIAGPGGAFNMAAGAAAAEEGITLEPSTDKNVMTIGADGKGQHSLVADDSGKIKVRLLKTSPINQLLQIMYDLQTTSSAVWGLNTITLSDSARGDFSVLQSCAFRKKPALTYAKEAGFNEWEFDSISVNTILGAGQ